MLHGLGLLDEALKEYNVALKLQVTSCCCWWCRITCAPDACPQPSSTLVYFNLGNIYLEKGYMENAQLLLTSMQVPVLLPLQRLRLLTRVQMYVHVISLDPLYRGAFNNLGNALKEADFFDHAIRCITCNVVPCSSFRNNNCLLSCNPFFRIRAWNAALRVLPTDVDVFANIMCYHLHSFLTSGSRSHHASPGTCACICVIGRTAPHGLPPSSAP